MLVPESVETLLDWLKAKYQCNAFDYTDANVSFRTTVRKHFAQKTTPHYGVYMVRQQSSSAILYIGKSGTLITSDQYKEQDIEGRLIAVRGRTNANAWFGQLVQKHGALRVEYIALRPPLAPAYVEAALLQAYLSEHGKLPAENKCL